MDRRCSNCRFIKPIEDNSVYSKPFDGHCCVDGDLIFGDDACDYFDGGDESETLWHDRKEASDMTRRIYLYDGDGCSRFAPNPKASWSDVLRKFEFSKWAYIEQV